MNPIRALDKNLITFPSSEVNEGLFSVAVVHPRGLDQLRAHDIVLGSVYN